MNQSQPHPHGVISSTGIVDPNQFRIADYEAFESHVGEWILRILIEKKIVESEWPEGVAEMLSEFVGNVLDSICSYQTYDTKTRKLEVRSIQGRT